jgi:hypothetical protein
LFQLLTIASSLAPTPYDGPYWTNATRSGREHSASAQLGVSGRGIV